MDCNNEPGQLSREDAHAKAIAVHQIVTAGTGLNIPPTLLAPDGSSYFVVSCYLKKAFIYLANVTICQTITDPVAAQSCVDSAYNAYRLDLLECVEA